MEIHVFQRIDNRSYEMKTLKEIELYAVSGGDSIPPCEKHTIRVGRDRDGDGVPEYFMEHPNGCLDDDPYTPPSPG